MALIANGLLDIWFSYGEQRALLVRVQAEQARVAAAKISHFVKEIEGQMGRTTQVAWTSGDIEQRRLEADGLPEPGQMSYPTHQLLCRFPGRLHHEAIDVTFAERSPLVRSATGLRADQQDRAGSSERHRPDQIDVDPGAP